MISRITGQLNGIKISSEIIGAFAMRLNPSSLCSEISRSHLLIFRQDCSYFTPMRTSTCTMSPCYQVFLFITFLGFFSVPRVILLHFWCEISLYGICANSLTEKCSLCQRPVLHLKQQICIWHYYPILVLGVGTGRHGICSTHFECERFARLPRWQSLFDRAVAVSYKERLLQSPPSQVPEEDVVPMVSSLRPFRLTACPMIAVSTCPFNPDSRSGPVLALQEDNR